MTNEDLTEKLLMFYHNEVERLTKELAAREEENRQLREAIIKLTDKVETKTVVVNPAPAPAVIPITVPEYTPPYPPAPWYTYGSGSVVPLSTTVGSGV